MFYKNQILHLRKYYEDTTYQRLAPRTYALQL